MREHSDPRGVAATGILSGAGFLDPTTTSNAWLELRAPRPKQCTITLPPISRNVFLKHSLSQSDKKLYCRSAGAPIPRSFGRYRGFQGLAGVRQVNRRRSGGLQIVQPYVDIVIFAGRGGGGGRTEEGEEVEGAGEGGGEGRGGDGEDGGARGILLRACLAFKLTEVAKNDHISAEQTLRVAGQEKL